MTSAPARGRRRRVRRNRISERDAIVVGVVAVLAGVAATAAGAHPTASRPADVVVTAAFVAFVTWCAASAPWWALGVAAAVATLTAASAPFAALGAAGFVIAVVIGNRAMNLPWARAVSAGLTFNALLWWRQAWFFGWPSLVTAAVAALVVAAGFSRRGRLARHRVRRFAFGLAVVAGVLVLGAVVGAALGQAKLRQGEREMRAAASALRRGDVETAVDGLARSSDLLAEAGRWLDRPWTKPAYVLPLIGQHVRSVVDVTVAAHALSVDAQTSVAQVNTETLRMINGVIDLDAVELLSVPFRATSESLGRTDDAIVGTQSGWLIPPVDDRLARLHDELSDLTAQTARAADAVTVAPSMLGRDGPRTYFVAFTTPAEARGTGGFMGAWAELRADGGRLDVVRNGTTTELTTALSSPRPRLTDLDEFLARYGRFGFGGPDAGPVAVDVWSNVTMSPDLPTVAQVIAQLYPASGGASIDGVIVMNVPAIARFLELTGPIAVDGPDGRIRIDEHNAVEYLLRTQYAEIGDDDARDAVLQQLTTSLLDDVFGGELPAPRVLGSTLGPAMDSGALELWSLHPDAQATLSGLGVSGALALPDGDGLAVVNNNAGANKLDAYLRRSIVYEATVDPHSGELRSTVTIRLTNTAPLGLPADAGGNPFGLPPSTNRTYVSVYSPWEFTLAELDGTPTGMESEMENGWHVYSAFVDIAAGQEIELRLGFAGRLADPSGYSLLLRSPAAELPDVVRLDVRTSDGRTLVSSHGPRAGTETISTNG